MKLPDLDSVPESAFPFGLRLFLRTTDGSGNLHFINLPSAHDVLVDDPRFTDFVAFQDREKTLLCLVSAEQISCIIPLNTEGNVP